MKKAIVYTCFFAVSVLTARAQNAEKQAIIHVIEGEHLAACAKDFDTFSSFYDHSENVIWGNGVSLSFKGWTEVENQLRPLMEQMPNPLEPSVFYNYQIAVAGDQAWATFDKKNRGATTPISKEQRILVKKDGEWKLVVMLFFPL
ncbi:nuclear transport factor 2 family protein [Cyclobacterium jeungdonense]|uniref:Nuclear transport factor 2 family protein n=1 Tax=Cyclobacterium jeungdonense TaxID=708087 RepID=A0ABT8C4N1_9BACT|nr:nuclear transport factor 2 family protein [Cyclobacterium jeungdonense]MDN3687014.1 nuclear transport factor 2 family protein [Cyclobacterium jeungdonense]